MVPFLPSVLHHVADKKMNAVRMAAGETGPAIIDIVVPHATSNVQPMLFAGIAGAQILKSTLTSDFVQ
jgi:hypothetical protein